ncbi:YkvA family protein [Vineibacter terrae]|uniref:YkvA family protein n=1 Tax=Vineibacter terrae TaxID=2586908 RepID=UPI002E31EE13|nr:YkvA family protein [Vineibacter terrae]HEX2886964.1 YkvA family protein [Vineibacter terrae]
MIHIAPPHGWTRRLEQEALAVWLAAQDPRTPWTVQFLVFGAAVYAFSPIDLIPDAIPVVGLLDDAVVVPLILWGALHLTPAIVLSDARNEAARRLDAGLTLSRSTAALVVALPILAAAALVWWAWTSWAR